jgi:putative ABC transport system ATP-binding protein
MTTPALELRDITMSIRDGRVDRLLLDRVNLSIEPGSVDVLTGPSGSGKTTLLTIAGLLRAAPSGEVLIAGQPTAALSERARAALRRSQVAIVYQSGNLLPALTALEQLELVGRIRGERRHSNHAEATRLLNEVGLTGAAQHRLPRELSGGERQRVGIARALIARPTVLIADEPTSALDPHRAQEITDLIASATKREGYGTLMVSHDDAPTARADHHLELVDGQVRAAHTMIG